MEQDKLPELVNETKAQEYRRRLMELHSDRISKTGWTFLGVEEYERTLLVGPLSQERMNLELVGQTSKTHGENFDARISSYRRRFHIPLSVSIPLNIALIWGIVYMLEHRPPKPQKEYDVTYIQLKEQPRTSPPLGFNPKLDFGQSTQSSNPNREIGDITAQYEPIIRNLAPQLEDLILQGKYPTELYTHTFKKGNSNVGTYVDFLEAYVDAFLRINHKPSQSALDILKMWKDIPYVMAYRFMIDKKGILVADVAVDQAILFPQETNRQFKQLQDGTIEAKFGIFPPGTDIRVIKNKVLNLIKNKIMYTLTDDEKLTAHIGDLDLTPLFGYYDRLLEKMPKKFIPPSDAGLQSPYPNSKSEERIVIGIKNPFYPFTDNKNKSLTHRYNSALQLINKNHVQR